MTLAVVRSILRFLFRLFFRIEFYGQDNVPTFGPVLLVPNHPSYLDPLSVHLGVRTRPVRWMTWNAVFRVPVLGWLIRQFGAFPVDMEGSPKGAFKSSLELLKRGEVVGIFPEGGRSFQPIMGDTRTGAIRLAVRSGAPIVPVSVAGAYRAWPRLWFFPRPGRIAVTYHPPIYLYVDQTDHDFYEKAMDQVKRTINDGLREAYVDWHLRRVYDPTLEELGLTV
ncbi:MAG: 1-acyl-sn-glycerol-3-phosphate acyltransferase [Planctomycetes bacterium]|nr:1-acyl-sn-glycerol-3-phosphate acyltransferase [Planctomycetota bacterium]